MALDRYLSQERTLFLTASDQESLFRELAGAAVRDVPGLDGSSILEKIWERERLASTKFPGGIAIPHARIEGLSAPILCAGLSRAGIRYGSTGGERVHLAVLILSGPEQHLEVLREAAARLSEPGIIERAMTARDRRQLYRILLGLAPLEAARMQAPDRDISLASVRHALALAEEIGAGAVIVHADRPEILEYLEALPVRQPFPFPVFAAVPAATSAPQALPPIFAGLIPVPQGGFTRTSRIELSLLFALSLGYLVRGDRVVSALGPPETERLDSVVVSDLDSAFDLLFPLVEDTSPEDTRDEVLARTIRLAATIAREGREGKPVGTIFVLGDYEQVNRYCQQMVINPFQGYDETTRSIMDPSLEETIKEFSRIDGAFIVRGDGVIMSAGTYLTAEPSDTELPSGYGSRHRAAAAVTAVTSAVSLVVSESTRKISLFRRGERFSIIE